MSSFAAVTAKWARNKSIKRKVFAFLFLLWYDVVMSKVKSFIKNFKSKYSFSKSLALLYIAELFCRAFKLRALCERILKSKDAIIIDYLKTLLTPVLEEYKNADFNSCKYQENAPIFICWWTGETSAPPLVKACIKSIRANAEKHPVYLINSENCFDFIDAPNYIKDGVKNGKIKLVTFTDYLRSSLLYNYGGLWLDATIFCTGSISEQCFKAPFFSIKMPPIPNEHTVSEFRWTAFCLGGFKGQPLFAYMKSAFDMYFSKHTELIDYFLVDYLIALAYNEIPEARRLIDAVEVNNPDVYALSAAFKTGTSAEDYNRIVSSSTQLYKLSWRESYPLKDKNGNETLYFKLIEK